VRNRGREGERREHAIFTLVYGFLLVPRLHSSPRPFTSAERLLVGRSFPRRVATP
jgi:hypothetical protein